VLIIKGYELICFCFFIYLLEDHYINNCCGKVVFLAARRYVSAEISHVAACAEGAYVAISAIKYNLLVEYCYTLKLLRATVSDASLKGKLHEVTDINGVKSSVELYGIKSNARFRDTSTLDSYRTGVVNYFFAKVSEKDFGIFKAITVSARVKYSVSFYTNSFQAFAGAA
jgi:hypothetical protein